MEMQRLQGILEAILFTMGESVPLERLALAIEHDKETTRKMLYMMKERYDSDAHGITLLELEDSFQLCTKKEAYEYLIKIAKQPRRYVLSDVLLETLSVVAYKQPVTKLEIEKIRGVKCDHAVNKLVEFGLVEEVGRMDVPGRPILLGTTEEFLRRFGVRSVDELPHPGQDMMVHFQEEAQEEVQLKF